MKLHVGSELTGGLLITAIGALGLSTAMDLEMGSASRMGPGYMPRLLAIGVILIVIGLSIKSLLFDRGTNAERAPLHLRPVGWVSCAIVLFGFLIDRAGIVLAVAAMTLVAGAASDLTRWREAPLLALALGLASALVFVVGLGLAMPVWPG